MHMGLEECVLCIHNVHEMGRRINIRVTLFVMVYKRKRRNLEKQKG